MSKLVEGYYKAIDTFYSILRNEDGKFTALDAVETEYPMQVEYGDFGEADAEVIKKSGMNHYNVKLTIDFMADVTEENKKTVEGEEKPGLKFVECGAVYDQGRKCSMKGMANLSELVKITDEELAEIRANFDPIEAPPGPYTIQPENQGKIIWITGAPGMGKSTSAQILARKFGYVYYEADCFGALKNPFVPLDVEDPSMVSMAQKAVKGPGMKERQALLRSMRPIWGAWMQGKEYDQELFNKFFREMARDVLNQKKRIGGNWAIAMVIPNAAAREILRSVLGPDLVIVVLRMSSEDRRERVLSRHGGDVRSADQLDRAASLMEPVIENEPNTIDLEVGRSMSRDHVVEKIRQRVRELES